MKSPVVVWLVWVCSTGYETRQLSKSPNSLHRKFGFAVVTSEIGRGKRVRHMATKISKPMHFYQ
ncbi:hypothetical protein E2C01_007680 [Portunus trituberculatus]|uniref:Uncharacterized protein n=1 Tax=Portunus trituberculatus TaxID=210409 RepID=A0A5B7CYT7_PORTR|nr:hypothetical protein [Portunus trituberculatus]